MRLASPAAIQRVEFHWPGGRRDPRWVMIGIHSTFTILGQTVLHFAIRPSQIAAVIITTLGWDLAFQKTILGRVEFPKSALITALGMGLLLRGPGLYPFIFAGTVAIFSKFFLRVNGRHIWNPNNFGLVTAILFVSGCGTIVGQWGRSAWIAFVMLNLGMFIIYRVRRFDVVITFFAGYFIANLIHVLNSGYYLNHFALWAAWHLTATPAVLLFTFFMITDPRTSPQTRTGRIIYCLATAALAIVFREHGRPGPFFALFVVLPFVPLLDRLLVGREINLLWWRTQQQPAAG